MKILMINRYGYPKYGAESYFFELSRMLREKGHEVIVFTTKNKRNADNEYAGYFVDRIDLDRLNSASLLRQVSCAPKTIYSFEAKQKIRRLIREVRPDVVHLHNIKRLISPSILPAIKEFKLPVVYTLHDYHLICPNYRLFSKGKICAACKGNKYYNAVVKRCVRNSRSFSLLACIEQYVHQWLKIFENNVDMFIAPSRFLRDKMIEHGLSSQKITFIPYFASADNARPGNSLSNYIVYCGRLVEEKGVATLIKAMSDFPSVRLLILGEGEHRKELERLAGRENINNVEFRGYLPKEALKAVIQGALFVTVPSLWSDNSPLIIYESFSMGKAVIGSDSGGIRELIDDGVNGFLFKPGDTGDLAEKMRLLLNHKDRIMEMGENGRRKALKDYASQVHYQKILSVYQGLVKPEQGDPRK